MACLGGMLALLLVLLHTCVWSPLSARLARPDTPLVVAGDTNRDGRLSRDDRRDRHLWTWESGMLILANVDDDDGNGIADAADTVVNGPADEQDLAIATITLTSGQLSSSSELWVDVNLESRLAVNLFQRVDDQWQFLDLSRPVPLTVPPRSSQMNDPIVLTLGIEAKQFAETNWPGLTRLTVRLQDEQRRAIATDAIALRVAPWLMLPNSARTTDLYIGVGYYENDRMRSQLERILPRLGVTLHEYESDNWQDMWTQDMMEIGYQEIPGHPGMHVVLRANRDDEQYPKTLLGPDVGYITVGEPRNLNVADELADWFGNLEVTPPIKDFPLGRSYYGRNTKTGVEMHPMIVDFLRRQGVQTPLWLDTSWLLIKHVDELISFVPAPEGQPYVLVHDMEDGIKLLQDLRSQGAGEEWIGEPPITVNEALETYRSISSRMQRSVLDRIIRMVKQDLKIDEDRIIRLPVVFTGLRNASTLWSNSVNSVFINGTLILGDPHAPLVNGEDYIQRVIRQRLAQARIRVEFVDDTPYQANHGNVHCATNTKRQTLRPQFWSYLSSS
ncbi:MAG: protein-arginine deiminase family protein [Elainellaceae cyanobacterium]